jgi:hypothetical protein
MARHFHIYYLFIIQYSVIILNLKFTIKLLYNYNLTILVTFF